jgi:hypothetical protein
MKKRNRENETHIMCSVETKNMLKEIAAKEERTLKTTLDRIIRAVYEKNER